MSALPDYVKCPVCGAIYDRNDAQEGLRHISGRHDKKSVRPGIEDKQQFHTKEPPK